MAKFYGIKFISELKRIGRYKIILLLVGIAWAAWFFFAIVPAPYNAVFLFINGFAHTTQIPEHFFGTAF